MRILVNRDGTQLGPYTEDEIRAALQAGTISSTDLAWAEGTPAWVPVSSLIPDAAAGAPPELRPAQPQYAFPQSGAETSPLAITSLVLSIVSFVLCLNIFASIPAVICGHIARSRIAASGGRLKGAGLALGGLVTGYINIVLVPIFVAVLLPAFMVAFQKGQEMTSLTNAHQIVLGCTSYATAHQGTYPATLDELVPQYIASPAVLRSSPTLGYDYFLAGQTNPPPNRAIFAGQWVNRKGERAVGRVNGTVNMEKFDSALEKP